MRIVNISGPINNLSYGNICCNLTDSLVKQGIQVNLKPIGGISYIDDNLVDSVKKSLNNSQDEKTPHIIIWHAGQLSQFKKEKCLNYGFPVFELDRFSQNEIDDLNNIDEIITTCGWYKNILQKNVNKKINIINLGVDNSVFNPNRKIEDISFVNKERLTFLNIGKWEIRKGHLVLPKILSKTLKQFPVKFKSRLIMMAYNSFLSDYEHQKWESFYKKELKGFDIEIIINRVKSHSQVADIIQSSDIGLFPNLAEGWNMGLHEMLSMGKSCVVSNYSAHTEYCNNENSILIGNSDNIETEEAFDGQWFFGQGNWLKFTDTLINEFSTKLTNLIKNKSLIKQEIIVNSVKHLTWENSAKNIIKLLWQNS